MLYTNVVRSRVKPILPYCNHIILCRLKEAILSSLIRPPKMYSLIRTEQIGTKSEQKTVHSFSGNMAHMCTYGGFIT